MAVSSTTLDWNALLSTTLMNRSRSLQDAISTLNAFLFYLMKKEKSGYVLVDDIGERAAIPIMYGLGTADSYAGFDQLSTEPTEGITTAFYDWRQAAVPVTISGADQLKNEGSEVKVIDLLDTKISQAEGGIMEFFDKRLLIGAGGSSITSPYTSAANGSSFVDPLPLLVKYDPTTSTVVGNINEATYPWWRNQYKVDTSSTFAGFLNNLRNLYNSCSKGPGGPPNLMITDQASAELYEAALATQNRFTGTERADIPFDNVLFRGKPVVWDEFTPDVSGGSETQSATSGTWYMLNTKFWQIKVARKRNFMPTKPREPVNQDVVVQHIFWFGAAMCGNRKKQGVMGSIDSTISS